MQLTLTKDTLLA
jgi:hypothetical protein